MKRSGLTRYRAGRREERLKGASLRGNKRSGGAVGAVLIVSFLTGCSIRLEVTPEDLVHLGRLIERSSGNMAGKDAVDSLRNADLRSPQNKPLGTEKLFQVPCGLQLATGKDGRVLGYGMAQKLCIDSCPCISGARPVNPLSLLAPRGSLADDRKGGLGPIRPEEGS